MHVATVREWSEGPKYIAVDNLPASGPNELQLRVLAAGVHQVVRSRASGRHYSARTLPHTVGIDAVGRDESTEKLYYCFRLQGGVFAEYINIDREATIPVPDGVDPVALAASVNPAMSSWMAITHRTTNLREDFTVLILGATTASGKMAVNAAKALGAGKVIGVARNEDTLRNVGGLDEYIVQEENIKDTDFSKAAPDLILDYVYGELAVHVLESLNARKAVQYITIGGMAQQTVEIPSSVFRSKDITMRGAGPGAYGIPALLKELKRLVPEMAGWKLLDAHGFDMKNIESVWGDRELAAKGRLVAIP
ncbi:hypothetical protein GGR57DRAFT_480357 [Xylariaceae sp. FL1272]|nr:hypothetical protein GGR57DRAFT_480357 [Xylariaceae sp. FL1272]